MTSISPHAMRHSGTGCRRVVLASLVWAGFNLVVIAITGRPPDAVADVSVVAGLLLAALLASCCGWLIVRTRPGSWSFGRLVALALPFYLVLWMLLSAVPR